jgi:hypothetical protein
MNWFYAENGSQRGPVDDTQLDQLVAGGAITPSTLVWHEGMANWMPYAQARPEAAGTPSMIGLVCAGCGKDFPADEVVQVQGRFVCAECKPMVLQRMMEGVSMPGSGARGHLSGAEILQRDYSVDVSGSLDRSWKTFTKDPWVIIGCSILAYLVLFGCAVIPIIGGVIQLVLQGAVMGGLWNFYIRKTRGENAGIAEAFAGFGPKFGSLLLTALIPGLIVVALIVAVMVPFFIAGVAVIQPGGGGPPQGPPAMFIIVGLVVGLAVIVTAVAVQMMWLFAPALVIDKGLGFWDAMELSRKMVMKRFWGTLGLCFVAWLVGMLGLLACGVGLLVSGPVAFGMLANHYDRVFGELAPQS